MACASDAPKPQVDLRPSGAYSAAVTLRPAVAFDASLEDEPTTGIGLYARCLGAELERLGVRLIRVGARSSGEYPRGRSSRTAFFAGRMMQLLGELDAPLFHAVGNFNLPLVRLPMKRFVLTVHDLIPDLLPDTVSAGFRWQFRLWLARSLQVADRVICVSERTREDLLRRFAVPAERISVVYNGVDHVDAVPEPDDIGRDYLRALALPEAFVLYAGALDARKNVELVLEACARLRHRRPVTLVLAGQKWFGAGRVERRVAELRAEGLDVRPLGYLADPIFYALMRRASVLVFPSRYEGFGLPPLEAMRLGVPTIVSSAGSLPEVCGDAAIVVDPSDANGLAAAIERLLSSPEERSARSDAGRRRAALFTWRDAARRTLEIYRQALMQ